MDNIYEQPAVNCWSENPLPETVPLMASSSVEAASAADSIPSSLAYSSGPSQMPPVNQQYPTPLDMANQYPPPAVPGMVYPQPYAPAPSGQPYAHTGYATPQPGYMYPSPPPVNFYYSPHQPLLPPQQQHQQVVYVGSQQVPPVLKPVVQMNGAIVLSCYVFWCCGLVFGGIAFILAMIGFCESDDGNTAVAKRCRTASYAVSLIGLTAGIVLIYLHSSSSGVYTLNRDDARFL